MTNEGQIVTARFDGKLQLKSYDSAGHLLTKTLPYEVEPDQIAFSPDETKLLVEWLRTGYILLDIATGKKLMGRKWTQKEKYLDVEFLPTGELVAYNELVGYAGSDRACVTLGTTGIPDPKALAESDSKSSAPTEFQSRSSKADSPERTTIVAPGSSKVLLASAKRALAEQTLNLEDAKACLSKLEGQFDSLTRKQQALTCRYKGELALAEGRESEALLAWDQALDLDPRVGIANKHKNLQHGLRRDARGA